MSDFVPELLLNTYASVVSSKQAIYCSMPITSGRRFLDWLACHNIAATDIDSVSNDLREDHRRSVIEPNREHALRVVQKLRNKHSEPIIDPSALPHIPDWTQLNWRTFWEDVIEQFAKSVYFVDDWAYSNGCTYEFYIAQRLKLPVYDEQGEPLSVVTGMEKIAYAKSQLQKRNLSIDVHTDVMKALEKLNKAVTKI